MIQGIRATKIGSFRVANCTCEHCREISHQRITVFGRYFHVFWIPVLPLGRKAVAECIRCKKTIKKRAFSPELKQGYQEKKSIVKRPLWHWSGLGILSVLLALIFIIDANKEDDPRRDLLKADTGKMIENPRM